MSTNRPRRSAAVKAQNSITFLADTTPDSDPAMSAAHRIPGRGAVNTYAGGEIITGRRNRGAKKNYVIDSTEDSDEDVEDEDMDAEGEEDDADADADADADGDVDMDVTPVLAVKKTAAAPTVVLKGILKNQRRLVGDNDDDEDELSDMNMDGAEYDSNAEDAEGEDDDEVEITVMGNRVMEEEEEEDDEFDSDGDIEGATETMDLSRMTRRQRAKFADDDDGAYLKLSDEVQVKKHLTAEELSMRRSEMARRRRNLSDKRNEEVKMETINKLLKKQARKTNQKAKTAEEEAAEEEAKRPDPTMIKWVSTKGGESLSVPDAILESPLNQAFREKMKPLGKLIEEVQ